MCNLQGKKFGKWTVLSKGTTLITVTASKNRCYRYRWKCRCECGTIKEVDQPNLISGKSKWCYKCRPKKHGLSGTDQYKMLAQTKARAKRDDIPFNLTIEDIKIPLHCPLLGIEINRKSCRTRSANSPSVDKINPKAGYIKGNVWVISWRANVIKHNATIQELELITQNLKEKLLHC